MNGISIKNVNVSLTMIFYFALKSSGKHVDIRLSEFGVNKVCVNCLKIACLWLLN